MTVIFSGIKPSGELNLGGYAGALSQFVKLQNQFDQAIYFVADLHAITVPQEPEALRQRSRELAAFYVAAGVDPDKAVIFIQSQVHTHAELSWILETQSRFGELSRMTQFKDKSEGKDIVSSALFTYPVLMAADILLYQTTHVPVGEDQKQHLELTRDLAIRFNNQYGDTFAVPEPVIQEIGSRVMGLDDPTKKMSKSNPNTSSYILLLDAPELIKKKISRAVTDSEMSIRYDWETKAAVSNLIEIYSVCSGLSVAEIEQKFAGANYGTFKRELTEVVVDRLVPLQKRYHEIIQDPQLDAILKKGRERALEISLKTLKQVKEKIGFVLE